MNWFKRHCCSGLIQQSKLYVPTLNGNTSVIKKAFCFHCFFHKTIQHWDDSTQDHLIVYSYTILTWGPCSNIYQVREGLDRCQESRTKTLLPGRQLSILMDHTQNFQDFFLADTKGFEQTNWTFRQYPSFINLIDICINTC